MSVPSTTDLLVQTATRDPLSEVLPTVLSAARRVEDEDLIQWVRLESSRYYPDNPGADENSRVPDYRKVRGRYLDARKNTIRFPAGAGRIVNQQVLPQPAGTLESFAEGDDPIFISDPAAEQIIREHLGVDPAAFYFRPAAAADVVHAIRNQLVEKLEDRRTELDKIHLPQMAPKPGGEEAGVLSTLTSFLFGSIARVVLLVIAGLIVTYVAWYLGWN